MVEGDFGAGSWAKPLNYVSVSRGIKRFGVHTTIKSLHANIYACHEALDVCGWSGNLHPALVEFAQAN